MHWVCNDLHMNAKINSVTIRSLRDRVEKAGTIRLHARNKKPRKGKERMKRRPLDRCVWEMAELVPLGFKYFLV